VPNHLLLLTVLWAALYSQQITGRVVTREGLPLLQVRVVSSTDETVTDEKGGFTLPRPSQLVRLSKIGYRPLTRRSADLRGDIVMEAHEATPWSPGICRGSQKRFGDVMRFALPSAARLETVSDVDYSATSVRHGRAVLTFGSGLHWNDGLPSPRVLAEMVTVEERDIQTPRQDSAVEYRGTRRDGTRWRTIVIFGESIEYDSADAVAAGYFDAVIDSLCFVR
jgi:hypothetical protein